MFAPLEHWIKTSVEVEIHFSDAALFWGRITAADDSYMLLVDNNKNAFVIPITAIRYIRKR